jgi:hypothetical protein
VSASSSGPANAGAEWLNITVAAAMTFLDVGFMIADFAPM